MALMPVGDTNESAQSKDPTTSPLLAKSAEGATFLILLQIGSRVLTFSANQFLLRYLTPEILGLSNQLEIYSVSVLFFAREALRVAVQRQRDIPAGTEQVGANVEKEDEKRWRSIREAQNSQGAVNLSYISILLGGLFASTLGWAYLRSLHSHPATFAVPHFSKALYIYGIAAWLELLAEPGFVIIQMTSDYKTRAAGESTAALSRCLVTCGYVLFATRYHMDVGVLPFAVAQAFSSVMILAVYYGRLWKLSRRGRYSIRLKKIKSDERGEYVFSYFPRTLLSLGASLFVQGIVKHLLSQGDTLLISYMASLEAQGVYALASNYGGLIARMVFQPVEESTRHYFGKLLSSMDRRPSRADVHTASTSLANLLHLYSLVSITAAAIGPSLAPLFLDVIAGSRWSRAGAGDVLARYCYYIPILAINGVTEAFISAVASKSELNRQSRWMFVFSLGFATAGYIFIKKLNMGATGLIWANAIAMTFRIGWGLMFIRHYFRQNDDHLDLALSRPKGLTIAAGFATAAVFAQMQPAPKVAIEELGKAFLITVTFISLLAISERKFLRKCYQTIREKGSRG